MKRGLLVIVAALVVLAMPEPLTLADPSVMCNGTVMSEAACERQQDRDDKIVCPRNVAPRAGKCPDYPSLGVAPSGGGGPRRGLLGRLLGGLTGGLL